MPKFMVVMTVVEMTVVRFLVFHVFMMISFLLLQVVDEPGHEMPSFDDERVEYCSVDNFKHKQFCCDDVEKMNCGQKYEY